MLIITFLFSVSRILAEGNAFLYLFVAWFANPLLEKVTASYTPQGLNIYTIELQMIKYMKLLEEKHAFDKNTHPTAFLGTHKGLIALIKTNLSFDSFRAQKAIVTSSSFIKCLMFPGMEF